MRSRDLTNQVFGRLTALKISTEPMKGSSSSTPWVCRCECGTEKVIRAIHLTNGSTLSCGCLIRQKTSERSLTHGHKRNGVRSPTYAVWSSIMTRCTNPKTANWNDYGGRGITVCERWRNSFEAFLEDVGERPSKDHSIDRKDVNGNYEPGNVRWATRAEQCRNKRTNRKITIGGETHCLSEWEEIKGLPKKRITSRLFLGWSEYEAVMTPNAGRRKC